MAATICMKPSLSDKISGTQTWSTRHGAGCCDKCPFAFKFGVCHIFGWPRHIKLKTNVWIRFLSIFLSIFTIDLRGKQGMKTSISKIILRWKHIKHVDFRKGMHQPRRLSLPAVVQAAAALPFQAEDQGSDTDGTQGGPRPEQMGRSHSKTWRRVHPQCTDPSIPQLQSQGGV